VPAHLPALEKARKLQTKAAKAGLLDRDAPVQAQSTLTQLLGEAPTAKALGELLWQVVALAHQHDLNAEDALRAYAVAFRQRHGGEGNQGVHPDEPLFPNIADVTADDTSTDERTGAKQSYE
jgi:uncharacterized protein YabN with tetrapyrrole methylase and pyrophosphatase domain